MTAPSHTAPATHDVTLTRTLPYRALSYDQYDSPNIVMVGDISFSVDYFGPYSAIRRVTGGPIVAGPHAWLAARPVVLAADPRMSSGAEIHEARTLGHLIHARRGDILLIAGRRFTITQDPRSSYPEHLTLVDADEPADAVRKTWPNHAPGCRLVQARHLSLSRVWHDGDEPRRIVALRAAADDRIQVDLEVTEPADSVDAAWIVPADEMVRVRMTVDEGGRAT